jgi:hypothetical protein
MFPIMREPGYVKRLMCEEGLPEYPLHVPLELLTPHAKQVEANHGGQSLSRLAERGGLDPREIMAILEDRPWRFEPMEDAINRLRRAVARWLGGRRPRGCP